MVIGDLNARLGKTDNLTEGIVRKYGENTKNDNGKRLIEFCRINNTITANLFYKHKDVHKYTKVVESRAEKSIINYLIIDKDNRYLELGEVRKYTLNSIG